MKNLSISSTYSGESLSQENVLSGCSINLLENVNIGEGITLLKLKCFYSCPNLKRVFLPNSLKTIEGYAFCDCISLLEIKLTEGITYTGDRIFFNCQKLENISIPATLTKKFGDFDFYKCSSLRKFEVSKLNPVYSSSNDESILIYKGAALVGPGFYETITIPDNVEVIESLFLNIRYNVKSINFSRSGNLKRIEGSAFRATSIKEIYFPEGLEYLGDSPLISTAVEKMYFPKSLLYVGDVFANIPKSYEIEEGCKAMKEIEGVVYDGNFSRILLLSDKSSSLNITKIITDLNLQQLRSSPLLKSLSVEDNHTIFWAYENVLYASNKSLLISCPGGVTNVSVWKNARR